VCCLSLRTSGFGGQSQSDNTYSKEDIGRMIRRETRRSSSMIPMKVEDGDGDVDVEGASHGTFRGENWLGGKTDRRVEGVLEKIG
jgi:hypothetical protein